MIWRNWRLPLCQSLDHAVFMIAISRRFVRILRGNIQRQEEKLPSCLVIAELNDKDRLAFRLGPICGAFDLNSEFSKQCLKSRSAFNPRKDNSTLRLPQGR